MLNSKESQLIIRVYLNTSPRSSKSFIPAAYLLVDTIRMHRSLALADSLAEEVVVVADAVDDIAFVVGDIVVVDDDRD